MLAPVPNKHSDLRETVRQITEADQHSADLKALAAEFYERIDAAVYSFHRRVEQIYLLEFLLQGVMTIERVARDEFVPSRGKVNLKHLRIHVAGEKIELTTRVQAEQPSLVRVVMKSHRYDDIHVFKCDVGQDNPAWVLLSKEAGFRRLIERFLPEHYVIVDENVFREALNESLRGPQPFVSLTKVEVQRSLSHLLDYMTSEQARANLAIGVREGASTLGKRIMLMPPLVAGLARQALPKADKVAPLLLSPPDVSATTSDPTQIGVRSGIVDE